MESPREKFFRELEHYERLRERGLTSFEIADRLIEDMLILFEIGFRKRYPDASEEDLVKKMRTHILALDRAKKERRNL